MKAVDTNVLLRYIMRDDEQQYDKAARFMGMRKADDPAFISLIVLVESIWTLSRRYGYARDQINALIASLVETEEFRIEEEHYLATLLHAREPLRGDLADHLIAFSATRAGCSETVTFDTKAARDVPSMELLA